MRITNALLCAVLAAPLAAIGCGSPSRGENHGGISQDISPKGSVSLEVISDVLPGVRAFDDDHNNSLTQEELDVYFRVKFERKDGIFDQAEVDQMKEIAKELRTYRPEYGPYGSPSNIKDVIANLAALIDKNQKRIFTEQDIDMRIKREGMFPPSFGGAPFFPGSSDRL